MKKYTNLARVEQIARSFTYHPPLDSLAQPQRYEQIRTAGREFALLLAAQCPESRELAVAITKLEESVMWANKAIAANESVPRPETQEPRRG